MKILRKSPWLVTQETYDVSWTYLNRGFFHQRVTDPNSPQYAQDNATEGATSEWDWLSNGRSINLSVNTPTTQPVLLADDYRNLLIIQNTSALLAGAGATDTAPTLFVNLDGPVISPTSANFANVGYALSFPPGFGILLDTRVLTNAIYVAYGPFTSPDNKVVVGGVITYGRTPNSPPLRQSFFPGYSAGSPIDLSGAPVPATPFRLPTQYNG